MAVPVHREIGAVAESVQLDARDLGTERSAHSGVLSDVLGFAIDFLFGTPPTYGAVSFATWTATGAHIRFAQTDSELSANLASLYINVGPDIDILCDTYRKKGAAIKNGPIVMPWGMKEFTVVDCDGYVLCFGTPV